MILAQQNNSRSVALLEEADNDICQSQYQYGNYGHEGSRNDYFAHVEAQNFSRSQAELPITASKFDAVTRVYMDQLEKLKQDVEKCKN